MKNKARFITSRLLFSSFEERDAAEVEHERVVSEKAKQKAAQSAAENQKITDDATSCMFVGRINSYKKSDLLALARALHLSEEGIVFILKDCTQPFLDE